MLESDQQGETSLGGRYVLGDLLGTGGVANVYKARDLLLDRDVAVKVFGQGIDPNGPERERVEMRTLARLSHPNLVTLHDAGTDASEGAPRAYLVMALIDGPSLAERLRTGPLPPEFVRRIGLDVATALGYVHSRDVVHRDVKPGNILLDSSGSSYLADFGVAQVLGGSPLTTAGGTVGTAAFMSPEQVRGQEVRAASDVYALGLVLLEALTGEREYPGTTVEAAMARLSRSPQVAGRVPTEWEDLLSRMTTTDPSQRPSAEEVASLLGADTEAAPEDRTQLLPSETRAYDGTQVLATGVPAGAQTHGAWRPGRTLVLIAAALLVGVVVLVAASLGGSGGSGTRVQDPPAGTPGPARLEPDLNRLSELVRS